MYKLAIFSFISCFFFSAAYAANELPDIGSSSSRVFSLVEEQAVGDDYMRQIRAIAPIVNDAEINDYIQHLGFKLVENNADAQDRQFSFFVVRENSINAFALPGGYIGIHTGLITKSDTESELASVLSHEIAHVTQRHLARRLELQNQLTLPSLAAFAAAILIASQSKSSQTGMGALMGAQGLAQQAMINHTRSNEAEADRIGISTLYKAGFDTKGAISFFEKMQENSRYYSNAFEFLRTHPLSRSRITDARLRAREYPSRRRDERLVYLLMKEKIKALTAKINPVTVDKTKTRYKNGEIKTDAQRYGYAVFMIRAKQFDVAEKILKSLRFSAPKQPSYAIALAQLDIERNSPANSIKLIESLLVQSPGNQALVETLAELYLAKSDYVKGRELLLANIHMTEYAPYLLKLLAEAQEGSGHQSEVYETEGNFLLAMGDLTGARIQFEQALNVHTEDPYARARLNSQLNRINEFIRQRSLRH
ncbi:M48 family metalloprotease [Aliikangiella coralliicola]|uniref:Putative beta-barrel assembly-enhancing protease n=1 Tax=Aliikangiella coralliicola TaxID=2592383 RepID=A0A545U8J5_9GAMM|nr:M48 family metalloprotease [Aliikangiella coralliicola]TQV85789.1 M48 family metallopeptidase [Aliikangiella coralliicola]